MKHHRCLFAALVLLPFLQTGCSFSRHDQNTAPPPSTSPSNSKKPWHLLPRVPSLLFFHHKAPPPPRAQALERVGIIRSLSADGSFVIIELEPGVVIAPGRALIVTAGEGAPIKLLSAESQPPYFIADIQEGQPKPGQTVFQ